MISKVGRPKRIDRDPVLERERLNKNQTTWVAKNRDKQRAGHLKRTYGLSWEDYLGLFAKQYGQCGICKTPLSTHIKENSSVEVAHVDHCHTTGKIRGLLCNKCNTGIGWFNDSSLTCKLAALYLEENV